MRTARRRIIGRVRGIGGVLVGLALTPIWLVTALHCSPEEFDAFLGGSVGVG